MKFDRALRACLTILPRDNPGNQNREPSTGSPEENYSHMATAAQMETNRRNRLSHGFTSSVLFIEGEEREPFNLLLADLHDEFQPAAASSPSSSARSRRARTELLNAQKERKKSEIGFESQEPCQPPVEPSDPPEITIPEPAKNSDLDYIEDNLALLMGGFDLEDLEIARKKITEIRALRQAS
jgi:hypothetical protein